MGMTSLNLAILAKNTKGYTDKKLAIVENRIIEIKSIVC